VVQPTPPQDDAILHGLIAYFCFAISPRLVAPASETPTKADEDDGALWPCDCTVCTLTSSSGDYNDSDGDGDENEDIYAVADWRSPIQKWTFPEWRPVDQRALEATTQLDDFLRAMKAPLHAQSIFPMQAYQLRRVAGDMGQFRTICAVGLNGGHAAVNWLVAAPSAHLYVFDAGDHAYTALVKNYLDAHFPGRATLILGFPANTVHEFQQAHPEVCTCNEMFLCQLFGHWLNRLRMLGCPWPCGGRAGDVRRRAHRRRPPLG